MAFLHSFTSGMDVPGLVPQMVSAFKSPFNAAYWISRAVYPGFGLMLPRGTPQKSSVSSRSFLFTTSLWAGRNAASEPVSLSPMAFGWPVWENAHAPGLPIFPVMR